MIKNILFINFLAITSALAMEFPIVGIFKPEVANQRSFIQKLVINADGTADITYSKDEPRQSMKLGKIEWVMERVVNEARGKVLFKANVEKWFDEVEAKTKAEEGPDSLIFKEVQQASGLFRNLGYDAGIKLEFLTASGKENIVLVHKAGLLVNIFSGEKLKKSWW
jgi:hypothetical protein